MSTNSPILAIETSADLCTVCCFQNEKTYTETNVLAKHIHSEKLISIVDNTIELFGTTKQDIGSVAISVGPGSFTGLRIGMAAAKGIAVGLDVPMIPVPTFDALALRAGNFVNIDEVFAVVSNVNRDEVYYSLYKMSEKPECIENAGLLDITSLPDKLAGTVKVFGRLVGSDHKFVKMKTTAFDVAYWAYLNGSDFITKDYDLLEPNYLKNFVAKVKK